MSKNIGSRLREERKRLGINQGKMGEVGGVGLFSQSNYETEKRKPDASYLSAVAEAGIDILYVLTGKRSDATDSNGIDEALLSDIADQLEKVASESGRKWPARDLIKNSLEIYYFLKREESVDEDKVERVVRLISNR